MKMLIAAILMFSTVAHAEYLAPRRSELRQQAVQKNVKSERNISRSLRMARSSRMRRRAGCRFGG